MSAGRDNGLRAGRNGTIAGCDDSISGGSAGFNRAVGSSGLHRAARLLSNGERRKRHENERGTHFGLGMERNS